MQKPRALWHESNKRSAIRSAELEHLADGIQIASKYSLISTGTERLVAKGLVPPALHNAMRPPYTAGEFDFPIKYGYSLTGMTTTSGQPVHLMHPHQDRCIVSPSDLHLLNDSIPLKRATLYANLETAVNAVWDAQVGDNDQIAVIGFGIVGALTAFAAQRMTEREVAVYEVSDSRCAIARELGFRIGEPAQSKVDIAFHTTASSDGLQHAINIVGFEGRVIELSWYGDTSVQINLGGSFHSDRKRIIASQVGSIAKHIPYQDKYAARHDTVLNLLEDDLLDKFITHTVPLDEAPELFDQIRKGNLDGLGYCIEY